LSADWDLSAYFSSEADPIESDVYESFRTALRKDTDSLAGAIETELSHDNLGGWVDSLLSLEALAARTQHLGSYLSCRSAADTRDERVRSENAAAAVDRAELAKLQQRIGAVLAAADEEVFACLLRDPSLVDAAYSLSRMRARARAQMEPPFEALATDLGVNGISAWSRLYERIAGGLEFDLALPGRPAARRPVSVTRSLLEDPDAEVRRAALEGANRAWAGVGDTLAACLNAIAGTRHTLDSARGRKHFLEPALFDSAVAPETLEAMLGAAEERAEVARSYLRTKAAVLGKERLGFQDLLAPLPWSEQGGLDWETGCTRMLTAFREVYPALAEFAQDAIDRRWIDHRPRKGKMTGAFCSGSPWIHESRVFMTYNETLGDLSTLAHELGHAFHGWQMRESRPWRMRSPMTLAETASTFAEQVLIESILDDERSSPLARATALDRRMQDAATFLLNIPMRFYFEESFYEARRTRELSAADLCELMCDAQERAYGDALAEDERDPWFWASKLHFYIAGLRFYNFPYTFGYLFSMGIFARALEEGPSFFPKYEALLRNTGSADAEELASSALGLDLTQPAAWHSAIDLLERDRQRFESALDELRA